MTKDMPADIAESIEQHGSIEQLNDLVATAINARATFGTYIES